MFTRLLKVAFFTSCILVGMQELQGQDALAFHAGGIASQMSGDDYVGLKKFGFEAGVEVMFKMRSFSAPKLDLEKDASGDKMVTLNKNLQKKSGYFFSVGLEYIQKGAQDRRNEEEGDFNWYTLKADYLQAPLSFWIPYRGVYLVPGVNFSYNVHWDQSFNGVNAGDIANQRTIETGLFLGVNLQVNDFIQVQGQFFHSLTPVTSSNVGASYWFRQGGMHSGLSFKLYFLLSKENFNWKTTDPIEEED